MKFISIGTLKKMGRQKKFVIPCLFTLLNACFGFFALIKIVEYDFIGAAYCIIGAVVMDILDGRVARALHSTSAIGMELDSLADAVSFCVAPALLLYSLYCADMQMIGALALSFYMCAGLSRLARFNVSEPKSFFTGLPTPVAAFFIAQCVCQESWLIHVGYMPPLSIIVGLIIALGVLMVSPVRYPSFKKLTYVSLCSLLCGFSVLLMISWWYQLPFFLLCCLLYIVCGGIGAF
jgi:CDP-diacylglycerol--serine O-phosphatidyltransferase